MLPSEQIGLLESIAEIVFNPGKDEDTSISCTTLQYKVNTHSKSASMLHGHCQSTSQRLLGVTATGECNTLFFASSP
eukprot:4510876-Amphidinium_carterae.1